MLYLADNLAYFPFQSQDEPLFIIHHINTMISVNGTNLLQNFREVSTIKYQMFYFIIIYYKIIHYFILKLHCVSCRARVWQLYDYN